MMQVIKEIPFGPIRHIKTGNRYMFVRTVIDATNARDGNQLALYYDESLASVWYARDIKEFMEKFEPVEQDDD